MKALTICQPYAHLIAIGEKVIENRAWAPNYRGPLLIHAGKSREWLDALDHARFPNMAFGAVVAVADLVGSVQLAKLPDAYKTHQHAHGPVCWLLARVKRLPRPISVSGAQGLWTPDKSLWRDALAQVQVDA